MTVGRLEEIRTLALEVNDLDKAIQSLDSTNEEATCKMRKALTHKALELEQLRTEYDKWLDTLSRHQKPPILLYYFLGHTKSEVLQFTGLCDSSWRRINQEVRSSLQDTEVAI